VDARCTLVYPAEPDPTLPASRPVATGAPLAAAVHPTRQWLGLHGAVTLDGAPAPAGTVVDVVDGGGRVAAWCQVQRAGSYGYLPVYLDDPDSDLDEGADLGEWLTVRVNGQPTGTQFQWTAFGDLCQLDVHAVAAALPGTPSGFALLANYPNPFNPATTISYQLPTTAQVSLSIYNTTGQRVRDLVRQVQAAGSYSVPWDGRDDAGSTVSAGAYFYRLEAGGFRQTRRMVLLK